MQLVMYLGNDFVAAVNVHSQQISVPGYMGKLKRQLMTEHSQLLDECEKEPEFLLVNLAPAPVRQGRTAGRY